jgi:dihydropyrimidinase
MDTIVRGGTVVTASDQYIADIGIEDGVITRIGRDLLGDLGVAAPEGQTTGRVTEPSGNGPRVVDATGTLVIPGAIDAHVHLDMPFGGTVTSDDYETGTVAAACGGVTTIVDYCLQSVGGSLAAALETWRGKGEGKAVIDYGFHIAVTDLTPAVMAELPAVVEQGVSSIKCFMAYKGVFQIADDTLFQLLEQARELGALVNVHAENGDVIDILVKRFVAEGMLSPWYHRASRPPEVEAEATNRAIALAELARAPLNVVHVTCREAAEKIEAARDRGLEVYGETCPQYLLLNEEQYHEKDWDGFGGAKYVMSPPLRATTNNDFLWRALALGNLQTLMTDHCSFRMRDQKTLGRDDFSKIPNGAPGIETRVPIAYSEGVGKGHFSLQQMVALLSTNAARMYGMYPRKGTIGVGSDADLVLIDPAKRVTLAAATLNQDTDYTPFEGLECVGYPVLTLSRGDVVAVDGTYVGDRGRGKFLRRGAHMSLS